jgi:hypothetical protein
VLLSARLVRLGIRRCGGYSSVLHGIHPTIPCGFLRQLAYGAYSLPILSSPLPATSPSSTPPGKPKPPPFKVASSVIPITGKLVQRIQALEFVDMRELLPDNIALAERLAALPRLENERLVERELWPPGCRLLRCTWPS